MGDRSYAICLIPGDGIGPEVIGCARRVLEALTERSPGLSFRFEQHPAGHDSYRACGEALPASTIDAAKAADGVLAGAMDVAAIPKHVPSPLSGLRRQLDVFANLRPARTFRGVPAPSGELDMMVVRENTEGMYSGIEYGVGPDAACGVRLITRKASTRVARAAFEQAMKRRRKVTAVHKLGALKLTDSLFLESVQSVAERFPEVEYETRNVDACALEMVRNPQQFDVILATNTFGDILSDIAAGLAGGLGLAPSGCFGERFAYFEPVHGSAPDIAGRGIANPTAAILSAAFMLRHLNEADAASQIEQAVERVLEAGSPRTVDLGGRATSSQFIHALIETL
jgi:isocitrate dehydrogenase (NAD+)